MPKIRKTKDVTRNFFPRFKVNSLNWTEKQKVILEVCEDEDTKIVFMKGPPGTSKTCLAVYSALQALLSGRISKIIYVRAPVEAGGKGIGFLPSDMKSKMLPYFGPAMDHFHEFIGKGTFEQLCAEGKVEILPLGFIQGLTFGGKKPGSGVCVICDEAADLTISDLKLLMCRLGRGGSQLFVTGDHAQSNIRNSGFNKVFKAFSSKAAQMQGIFTFEFYPEDCLRNDITRFLVEMFESLQTEETIEKFNRKSEGKTFTEMQ